MAREFARRDRVAQALQRELGELITTELKDPRVNLAVVSDVELSPDLRHAKVFVAAFDVTAETDPGPVIIAGLESAAGFIKKTLARRLRLRVMPELVFVWDTTERDAQAMDRAIEAALAADERHRNDDNNT